MAAELSPRMEDYLEAVLVLQKAKPVARVGEIAEALGVRKPTVTAALKTLAEGGFVEHESYGYIQLTPKGRRAARAVSRRHELLTRFFAQVLGVPVEVAEDDACHVEHYISRDTLERLTRFVEFVEKCPRSGPVWLANFMAYTQERGAPDAGALPCADRCGRECLAEFRELQQLPERSG